MSSIPTSVSLTATPVKIADIKTIGQKLAVHTKSTSAASARIYLTQSQPDPVVYDDYTHEIEVGGLYETPMEHVGEVWAASSSSASVITVTKYG